MCCIYDKKEMSSKRSRAGYMKGLDISPFIAPYAEEMCQLLSLYGGAAIDGDGHVKYAVTYLRKEGVHVPRIVHVQCVNTAERLLFILNEVTGEYTSNELRLWPLSTSTPTHNTQLVNKLGTDMTLLIEDYLTDILPIRRPGYAYSEHLRRRIKDTEYGQSWVRYWQVADELQKNRDTTKRCRANKWRVYDVMIDLT